MNVMLLWLRKKRVWIPLTIYIAYSLFGFFVLPGILRSQIVDGIRKNFGREARLAKVRFNPLILSLSLEGFELFDHDGTSFVAFDRLYLDLRLSSLFRWALTFREFRLDGPRVQVRLLSDGKLNFDDMVPKEEGKPPRLIIGRFQINRGSIHVANLMGPHVEEGTFAPIDLTLDNFTTIPQKEGLYRIVAKDPGGGSWQWTGELTFEPIHSAGSLEISGSQLRPFWEVAKHRVGFEIKEGQLDCRLNYAVDVRGDSLVARVRNSSLAVTGLTVREQGQSPELLRFNSLTVAGVEISYPEQTATVGRVALAGARIQAWMNPDTTLNWMSMLALPTPVTSKVTAAAPAVNARAGVASSSPVPRSAPAAPRGPPPPDWTVRVGEVAIDDLGVAFEDRTTDPIFQVSVAPVNARIRNLSSRPGAIFDATADVTIAETGRLDVSGKVGAQPPSADLEVRLANFPLAIFQPYINPYAKLQLVSGTVGASGAVRFRDGGSRPDVSFKGRAESHGFLSRDRIENERFLAWKSIDASPIEASTSKVRIGSVRIAQPFGKLLIHKNRTTNLQAILGLPTLDSTAVTSAAQTESPKTKGKKGKKAQPPQPKPSEALAAMQHEMTASAPPVPVRIGQVQIVDGSADFADLSLILPFAARIEHLGGTVKGLSSDTATRAVVALDGKLAPTGTAQVRGEAKLLAKDVFLDLGVVFRDFSMPVLTPYGGQFLGREIDKGRMTLDLGYRLQGRHLVGTNKIELDELELGEKIESPEATGLPVGLAIAILKDREGKIDLDMPVEGDLDDPKFRIGKIIWDFILSLLTKVATAPFALLGSLFGGGGDELSHVDFEPGAATIPPDQLESLSKLAEAIGKRPQLSLEVRGSSQPDSDAAAIRRAKFAATAGERLASNPKRYGSGLGVSPRLLDELGAERLGKRRVAALKERFEVEAGTLDPSNPRYREGSKKEVLNESAAYAAIQDTLTGLFRVDEAELLSLANARAAAIKSRLIEAGVEEGRVFVLDPESGRVVDGRIRIELALTQ